MAEWVAGKGTTALGIIGTILGAIGTVGNGTSLLSNTSSSDYVTKEMFEHNNADLQTIAEKDAEIQALKMAASTDTKIIDTYKELQAQINTMKEQAATRWTDQMVTNSNLTSAVNVNTNNLAALQSNFNDLTKIVIPSSNVCNTCSSDL